MLSILGLFAVFMVAGLAALYYLQWYGTFPSPPASAQQPQAREAAGGEAIWLDVDGRRVETWLLPGASTAAAPLLMYAHGNGELIDFWADEFAPIRAAGIHVLLVEYPGYGRSQGRPSERSITATLVAAYDRVAGDPRVDARRIFGHGRSLGGGAMAQLAARRPLAALILESSFTSLEEIIRSYHVPDWLVLNRFDTRTVLATFQAPVLVLHGKHDDSIPVGHAQALAAAARGAQLHLLDCGHNNCPRQWELVLSFLAANGVCRNPDQETTHEKVDIC
jgi:pimeloyl-ACP methyl ester carboxylesterase